MYNKLRSKSRPVSPSPECVKSNIMTKQLTIKRLSHLREWHADAFPLHVFSPEYPLDTTLFTDVFNAFAYTVMKK